MPKRLPVVLAQSRFSGSQQRAFEEELVPRLLCEENIDLMVIPHLEDIQADDTAHLCLQGISGSFVLLSWLPPDEAHSALTRHGIIARRGRTSWDTAGGPSTAPRAVYCVNLAADCSLDAILQEIRRIRDDLLTPTISLDKLLAVPPRTASVARHAQDTVERAVQNGQLPEAAGAPNAQAALENPGHDVRQDFSEDNPPVVYPMTEWSEKSSEQSVELDDQNLDRLLDELDQFMR
jgi:hypothetical protein